MRSLQNILRLGLKELRSLRGDTVLMLLVLYAFTYGIYGRATGISSELKNASIAVVDEDHSALSRRLADSFLPPAFKPAVEIESTTLDPGMDSGLYTFVLDIPPDFERDALAGRHPGLQINTDATAIMQAGIGLDQLSNIVSREVTEFVSRRPLLRTPDAIQLTERMKFNPNLTSAWFMSVMELINNVTMLAMILAGGALIREHEHGTIDHLMVMPLRPYEIMLAKVWSNGLVILVAATLALLVVIKGWLGVPVQGSVLLFAAGTGIYLFAVTSLGILLATVARNMPQFGLLFIMVALPMCLLSGGNTPLESMPPFLQGLMKFVPSTYYVSFAQAILYRQAGFSIVWMDFAMIALIGSACFGLALWRFRKIVMVSPA